MRSALVVPVHRYPAGGHRKHTLAGHRARTEAFLRAISGQAPLSGAPP